MTPGLPIFDGHNDVLLRIRASNRPFFERGTEGHLDLPRAREGGLGGGFCAIFVPSSQEAAPEPAPLETRAIVDPAPEPERIYSTPSLQSAQSATLELVGGLHRLQRESRGGLQIVRSAADIEGCLSSGVFAALMHIEGAEAIDPEFYALEAFYGAGLRSLGLVWSRSNAYGHGVPFKHGVSPDTGPGLTDLGRELVRACNRLRIVVDLSHLNEQGFWDVAAVSQAPLIATHSNAHAVAPATRNLTDRQLDAIRESDGMVGVNFAVYFLTEDGSRDPATPLTAIVRHIQYLAERVGIDRVGFGSDFDGAAIPNDLGDVSGLPRLVAALREAGFDDDALRKVTHENWVRVLRATWGA